MGKRIRKMQVRARAKANSGMEPSSLYMTTPPGSAPETGTRQLTLGGGHINWNQFGGNPAKGVEYNWKDQKPSGGLWPSN